MRPWLHTLLMTGLLAGNAASARATDFEPSAVPEIIASDGEDYAAPSGDAESWATDADESLASTSCLECLSGTVCSRCAAPPYGLANRLIDNKKACWTLRTDALLLWRDAPRNRPLFNRAPGGLPALNANQLESAPAAGPRFSLFRTNDCGDALEATYFRAANFRAQSALATVPEGYAPVFGTGTTSYDTASANLGSALQSFELNGRMTVLPAVQLLGGFRWFEWTETMQLSGNSAAVSPAIQDVVNNSCTNSLYGYQIGFDSLLLNMNWLRLEGLMKGGAYYNNAVQRTSATTVAGPYSTAVGSPHAASFLGEVGLTGVIPVTRNLDFRVGYLGLWLQGIAQPSLQQTTLDPTVPATLNTTGTAVVQGITLGLEGRW